MASNFKRGEVLLIPFRDGVTVSDSQGKPRIYRTKRMFDKSFPKLDISTGTIELVEYREVRHAHWYKPHGMMPAAHHGKHRCSACNGLAPLERPGREWLSPVCPNCAAIMDEEGPHETD